MKQATPFYTPKNRVFAIVLKFAKKNRKSPIQSNNQKLFSQGKKALQLDSLERSVT